MVILKTKSNHSRDLVDVARLNSPADGPSLADLIGNTRALLAMLDVIVDLSTDALEHSLCLPDFRARFWVFERLQINGDSLCLREDLDVLVISWQFVGPLGDLKHTLLGV